MIACGSSSRNTKAPTYHRGDLRAALLKAATDMILKDGLDAFTLRAVARKVGVSAMAPAHHFGNGQGLLTEIATVGFVELGDALQSALAGPADRARLVDMGHEYVAFALRRPGIFRLMWRKDLLNMADARHVAAGRRAFDILDRAVRPDGPMPATRDDPMLAPSIACWSLVHGFAMLALDGALAPQGEQSAKLEILLEATLSRLDVG